MKRILSIPLIIIMIFSFFACKEDLDAEYLYLPKTESYTQQTPSGFYREYKNTYKYDDNGNIIRKVEYTKNGIFYTRERQHDIKYTYNKNGDISQEQVRIEEFRTSITDVHYIYEKGYNYIYNENQQLIKKEIMNSSNYDDAFLGYEYEYDKLGNRVKKYEYFANGIKKLEFENIYDLKNKLIKKLHMDTLFNSMYILDETDYTYDKDGKIIHAKTAYYELPGEKSHYNETNYYYRLNRLVKKEETIFENDKEITNKCVREYKDFIKIKKN